jgi:phage tail-like protein
MTATVPMLAPVRRPPHDPLALLLDARTGWSVLDAPGAAFVDGVLRLARDPATLHWPTDEFGTFGGLRLPDNVAEGSGLWLLDHTTGRLLRFDPCRCGFVPVRMLGVAARAIAVCADRLFVTAGDWLKVVALPTTALAAKWQPPPTEPAWEPTGVVVDAHRQVHVADKANGRLHSFSWTGRYLGSVAGIGASTHLALARDGSIYAADSLLAYRVTDGSVTPVTSPSDDLTELFAPLPFEVDPGGYLRVGPLCEPSGDEVVDLTGAAADVGAPPAAHPYLLSSSVVLGPLDSRLDGCVWHRTVLRASVPAGCAVTVRTFTAHTELPASEVLAYPDSAWSTRLAAHGALASGEWDCLLNADAGRYLWLRLDLTGTGTQTPDVAAVEVEYPRISLRRYLPAVYGDDADSASFTDRFLALFDRSLRDVELLVDGLPADLDAGATPYLDWLSDWVGLTSDIRLPEAVRRRLLAGSARLYDLRGTPAGLRELLIIVLGLDRLEPCPGCGREPGTCSPARECCPPRPPEVSSWEPPPLILEHFRLRRWLRLGASRIGDDAVVWGRRIVNRSQLGEGAQVGTTQLKTSQDPLRDPFHVYAHKYTVFLPASAGHSEQQRKVMRRLLDFATPSHTAGTVEYVEPRFRIGIQSSLGLDSVVARVPTGLVLGETPLGRATVLTGDPSDSGGPRALGITTVLG